MQEGELDWCVELIGSALRSIDSSGTPYRSTKPPFREYAPGVGPYSETVLCQRIAEYLRVNHASTCNEACTRRFPDLLLPGRWAIELKLARPFGDNGKEAEHWSQNLLHPYPGNTSSLSDAMKLLRYEGMERSAVVVVGYEHQEVKVSLDPLIASFEAIAQGVLALPLGPRVSTVVRPLRHQYHQVARIWAWEVVRGSVAGNGA